ncbi:hypothetical protein DL767_005900 [Monosporascus sp. MG133]|nr:hypothetical protein DL767_005900 [Monosporascus sp. MG133]
MRYDPLFPSSTATVKMGRGAYFRYAENVNLERVGEEEDKQQQQQQQQHICFAVCLRGTKFLKLPDCPTKQPEPSLVRRKRLAWWRGVPGENSGTLNHLWRNGSASSSGYYAERHGEW